MPEGIVAYVVLPLGLGLGLGLGLTLLMMGALRHPVERR